MPQKRRQVECSHGRRASQCKACGGKSICEHGKIRSVCNACGGSAMCVHNNRRIRCKSCGGTGICEHGRQRYSCKPCGGAGICAHGHHRHKCTSCSLGLFKPAVKKPRASAGVRHSLKDRQRAKVSRSIAEQQISLGALAWKCGVSEACLSYWLRGWQAEWPSVVSAGEAASKWQSSLPTKTSEPPAAVPRAAAALLEATPEKKVAVSCTRDSKECAHTTPRAPSTLRRQNSFDFEDFESQSIEQLGVVRCARHLKRSKITTNMSQLLQACDGLGEH